MGDNVMFITAEKTQDIEKNTNTITTLEIAEMMELEHWQILRKLDGQEKDGKHIPGYVEILRNNEIVVTDYFIKSTYVTTQNKTMPCYEVTKMGCDFLANKFTGEKGILFTARYVKRFHDMEEREKMVCEESKKSTLSETTEAAKLIKDVYEVAGVDPRYIAVSVNAIYKEAGLNLPLPIEMKEDKLYDQTEIAKELGIMSTSGKPHSQAVGTIISMLDIAENDKISTPYVNHGHSGVVMQYTDRVLAMVREWLKENGYPRSITGNSKSFKVSYV